MPSFPESCLVLFKRIPGKHAFNIHVISSKPEPCDAVFRADPAAKWFVTRKLILLSNEQKLPTRENPANVFIYGMETLEYEIREVDKAESRRPSRNVVYISKIDSSGYWHSPRADLPSPNRLLVQAYISSLPQNTDIYIFARAQPQYLFASSSKNPQKRVLDHRGLIRWWKRTLSLSLAENTSDVKAWWLVPNIETEHGAKLAVSDREDPVGSLKWTYGHPYGLDESAEAVIPRFPDDAKSRLFTTYTGDAFEEEEQSMTVRTFWELLSIGEECGGNSLAGFFTVKGVGGDDARRADDASTGLTTAQWTDTWNKLLSQRFSTIDDAIASTAQFAEHENTLDLPKPITINIDQPMDLTPALFAASSDASKIVQPTVNVLGAAAIKRKARNDVVIKHNEESEINVLNGNSIKRKKMQP